MSMGPQNEQQVSRGEQVEPFNAVIVYEDEPALKRVLPIFQRLIREFAGQTEFKCIWVSFDNLRNQVVADDAAETSSIADMVIFSSQSRELPPHVSCWIESWLPHKNLNNSALAALISSTGEDQEIPPALWYLKTVAARAHMEFLSEFRLPNEQNEAGRTVALEADPEMYRVPVPNHWGINE